MYHLTKHRGDRFRRSGASLNRAFSGLVSTTTIGALLVLLLLAALGYDVPYFLAPIAPGNAAVRVRFVEDGHFDWSPSTRREGDYGSNHPRCFDKGGPN